MVDKYDVKKAHRGLYSPSSREFVVVEVPEFRYLAVDGRGDPNTSSSYANAVQALYGVAYTLKFASRRELGRDFVVGPLEGLWRAEDPAVFHTRRKEVWEWTMMISQPPWVTEEMVRAAVEDVARKKTNPALSSVGSRSLVEGLSVQILHLGPYDDEGPTLERLHTGYLPDNGLTFNGDHHEIYLSDPRRTAAATLRTVLRQPVSRVRSDQR